MATTPEQRAAIAGALLAAEYVTDLYGGGQVSLLFGLAVGAKDPALANKFVGYIIERLNEVGHEIGADLFTEQADKFIAAVHSDTDKVFAGA